MFVCCKDGSPALMTASGNGYINIAHMLVCEFNANVDIEDEVID